MCKGARIVTRKKVDENTPTLCCPGCEGPLEQTIECTIPEKCPKLSEWKKTDIPCDEGKGCTYTRKILEKGQCCHKEPPELSKCMPGPCDTCKKCIKECQKVKGENGKEKNQQVVKQWPSPLPCPQECNDPCCGPEYEEGTMCCRLRKYEQKKCRITTEKVIVVEGDKQCDDSKKIDIKEPVDCPADCPDPCEPCVYVYTFGNCMPKSVIIPEGGQCLGQRTKTEHVPPNCPPLQDPNPKPVPCLDPPRPGMCTADWKDVGGCDEDLCTKKQIWECDDKSGTCCCESKAPKTEKCCECPKCNTYVEEDCPKDLDTRCKESTNVKTVCTEKKSCGAGIEESPNVDKVCKIQTEQIKCETVDCERPPTCNCEYSEWKDSGTCTGVDQDGCDGEIEQIRTLKQPEADCCPGKERCMPKETRTVGCCKKVDRCTDAVYQWSTWKECKLIPDQQCQAPAKRCKERQTCENKDQTCEKWCQDKQNMIGKLETECEDCEPGKPVCEENEKLEVKDGECVCVCGPPFERIGGECTIGTIPPTPGPTITPTPGPTSTPGPTIVCEPIECKYDEWVTNGECEIDEPPPKPTPKPKKKSGGKRVEDFPYQSVYGHGTGSLP
jgi:hypothetical protein